jgi:hypothetical protein
VAQPADVDRTYFRGAILGTAIGDALGRPVEGWFPDDIVKHHGTMTDFIPRFEWGGGPPGLWSDDTQMTLCVARSLLVADGGLDVDALSRRTDRPQRAGLVEWVGRGAFAYGSATVGDRGAGLGACVLLADRGGQNDGVLEAR